MVTSLISIGFFFYPEPFFRLAAMVANGISGGSG
jgi:hypothetical protein